MQNATFLPHPTLFFHIAFIPPGLLWVCFRSLFTGMQAAWTYRSWFLCTAEFLVPSVWFGEGDGTPLQYPCLENPMDGGAWWAAVYGVAQSRTRLKWLSSSSSVVGYIVASQKVFSAIMTFIWPLAQCTECRWTCKQILKVWWELVGGQEMEVRKEWVGGPESSLGQYLQRLYPILGLCECWACYFLKPKPLEIGAVLFFSIKEVARKKTFVALVSKSCFKKT